MDCLESLRIQLSFPLLFFNIPPDALIEVLFSFLFAEVTVKVREDLRDLVQQVD